MGQADIQRAQAPSQTGAVKRRTPFGRRCLQIAVALAAMQALGAAASALGAGRGPSRLEMIAAQQSGRAAAAPGGAMPAIYRQRAPSDGPDIFGTTALKVARTAMDVRWREVSAAGLPGAGPWASVIAAAHGMPWRDQVRAINAWVNARVTYADDAKQYRTPDHWANAAQTLGRRAGDCEDYAIAKMQMLLAAGFPANDLFFVLMRDLVHQADHAALVVRIDGEMVMLDNRADTLIDTGMGGAYRPILSYSGGRSWVHGYQVAQNDIGAAYPR